MAKKKHEEKHENHERWLLSYADFMTLLMIFFVVMYAMSTVDVNKYKVIAQSLSSAMGEGITVANSDDALSTSDTTANGSASDTYPATQQAPGGTELADLRTEFDEYIKSNGLSGQVTTSVTERGLDISLSDNIMFESGKAYVGDAFKEKLAKIGAMLKQSDKYVRVEGNT